MVSLFQAGLTSCRSVESNSVYNSVVARYRSGKYFPRPTYWQSPGRPSMRDSFVYHVRSFVFFLVLLSVLSQEAKSLLRSGGCMASCWNSAF